MAAATVTATRRSRFGRRRIVEVDVTAPANDSTWDTGLKVVNSVVFSFPAGNLAAADSVSYTASGGTVTFKVVGTARDLTAIARGV